MPNRYKDRKKEMAYELEIIPVEDFDFLNPADSRGYKMKKIGGREFYVREVGSKKEISSTKKIRRGLLKIIDKAQLNGDNVSLQIYRFKKKAS